MNKKEALTQLEIMATNATGRLGEAKSEEEKALLSKEIEALDMGINAINWRNLDNETLILPSGELLVDTKHANEAKSVRLMDREGFTRTFKERKTGEWRIDYDFFHSDPMDNPCYCSICKRKFHQSFKSFPYCPVCGSEMERSKE